MKEGWKYIKIKDVGQTQTGTTPSKSVKSNYGVFMPFIRPAELNIDGNGAINYDSELKLSESGVNKSRLIKAGSILMCCIGSVGKTGFSVYDVTCNQQINTLTPTNDYDARFVYYALLSPIFQNNILKIANSAKATLAIISKGKWENLSIPVPPLSEQESIVTYLDTAFAKIDAIKQNAEKSLADAKALFQSALKEMMTPKEGWEEKTLGEICDVFGRIGFRGYTKNDLVDGPEEGAITLSPSNIQNGRMDYNNCTYISWFKYEESPEIMINDGDVLIVKTGSYGKSALVENLPHKATINPQSVVVKNIKINNKFFAYSIQTPWIQNEFSNFVSGTAIPTFSQAKLKQVIISFPPLQTQRSIVSHLDSLSSRVSALEENYTKTIAECNAMKQALLRQVFE